MPSWLAPSAPRRAPAITLLAATMMMPRLPWPRRLLRPQRRRPMLQPPPHRLPKRLKPQLRCLLQRRRRPSRHLRRPRSLKPLRRHRLRQLRLLQSLKPLRRHRLRQQRLLQSRTPPRLRQPQHRSQRLLPRRPLKLLPPSPSLQPSLPPRPRPHRPKQPKLSLHQFRSQRLRQPTPFLRWRRRSSTPGPRLRLSRPQNPVRWLRSASS